jgi:hypothetical protein
MALTVLDFELQGGFAIEPSDTADLRRIIKAIAVTGEGGDILYIMENDPTPIIIRDVPSGATVAAPRAKQVRATLTTATGLVGIY